MLMTAEPRGAGTVLGTGCTCEGLCRFYQRGFKYLRKWGERAKTTTVVTVYDFMNSLQLLWWLCDAEDWQRARIHASISILTHVLLISWSFFFFFNKSRFCVLKWCKSKDAMQDLVYFYNVKAKWSSKSGNLAWVLAKTVVRALNHTVQVWRFWQLCWHIFCFRWRGLRAADLLQQVWLWVMVLAVQSDLNHTMTFNHMFNMI